MTVPRARKVRIVGDSSLTQVGAGGTLYWRLVSSGWLVTIVIGREG